MVGPSASDMSDDAFPRRIVASMSVDEDAEVDVSVEPLSEVDVDVDFTVTVASVPGVDSAGVG
jgi:hypothetical protein